MAAAPEALDNDHATAATGAWRAMIHAGTGGHRLRATRNWGVPKIRALYEATYFTGLRKAGMPEE